MLQIDISEAKVHLAELAYKAADGESFIITDTGKPLAKVVGCGGAAKRSEIFGCMRGQGRVAKELDFKACCRGEIAEIFGLEPQG